VQKKRRDVRKKLFLYVCWLEGGGYGLEVSKLIMSFSWFAMKVWWGALERGWGSLGKKLSGL